MSSSMLCAAVEDLVLVLREEVRQGVVAELDLAGGGRLLPGKHADECRFACAVCADEGDAVAAVDL